ncbi:hypothetical protein VW23_021250 [Devosia insulae DS-56]|uniref:Uncharacterized protein n=1 Tax=Devosia insulae DS-56 TaxID=1116389 RepID=A0A1E5XPD0_9HYPH|nr:hypothetical protein [Devosia insulae]OEO30435.1 hypothetical protein VW23_021250 [Devosia insulae DS-56]
MSNDSQSDIGATLRRLAQTSHTPKQLLRATLERHPGAKKKDIAHAAFRLMIETAERAPDRAVVLHEVALSTRAVED